MPKIQIEGSRRQSSVTEGLKALENQDYCPFIKRRNLISISGFGLLNLVTGLSFAEAAGLPPEEKPKLCDDTCEKELENVWWDYVVPSNFLLPCYCLFYDIYQ